MNGELQWVHTKRDEAIADFQNLVEEGHTKEANFDAACHENEMQRNAWMSGSKDDT